LIVSDEVSRSFIHQAEFGVTSRGASVASDAGPPVMLGIFRMTDSLIFDAGQRQRGRAGYE